jgi:hypothetical protein
VDRKIEEKRIGIGQSRLGAEYLKPSACDGKGKTRKA